jgi:hypothetical protein
MPPHLYHPSDSEKRRQRNKPGGRGQQGRPASGPGI